MNRVWPLTPGPLCVVTIIPYISSWLMYSLYQRADTGSLNLNFLAMRSYSSYTSPEYNTPSILSPVNFWMGFFTNVKAAIVYNTSFSWSGSTCTCSRMISCSTEVRACFTCVSMIRFTLSSSASSPARSKSLMAVRASPLSCAAMAAARLMAPSSTALGWKASFTRCWRMVWSCSAL